MVIVSFVFLVRKRLIFFRFRLIVYGSFLILCCALLRTSSAENRSYKRWRTDEDTSVERPSNYRGDKKYKTKYRTDNSEEDHKINKRYSGKPTEESDFTREKKYSKYAKEASRFGDVEEEPRAYRKSKKSYNVERDKESEASRRRFDKKKSSVAEDDSDEDSSEDFPPSKKQFKKDKQSRLAKGKIEEEPTTEETARNKKYPNRRVKDAKNEDDESSEEETARYGKKITGKTKNHVEAEEEVPKKEFRRKIRVRIPDSPEEDSDESDEDEGTCKKKSRKGRSPKGCPDEESTNGDDESEEPVRTKKIKYSIKFAHEKEKSIPSEDDNIMMKIHRGEKKKYRWV